MDLGIDWLDTTMRLGVAAVLGGLLGLEREMDGQDAGFRTHLLLALGAAVFGVISIGAFDAYTAPRADTNVAVDITRIASYVAAGVGFIGGGAILKHAGVVKGITTASSLWAAAAVGLASGLGHWPAAIVATAMALVALAVLQPVSRMISRRKREAAAGLWIVTTHDADVGGIIGVIHGHGVGIRSVDMSMAPGGSGQELAIATWRDGAAPSNDLVATLTVRPDVTSVSHSPPRVD